MTIIPTSATIEGGEVYNRGRFDRQRYPLWFHRVRILQQGVTCLPGWLGTWVYLSTKCPGVARGKYQGWVAERVVHILAAVRGICGLCRLCQIHGIEGHRKSTNHKAIDR